MDTHQQNHTTVIIFHCWFLFRPFTSGFGVCALWFDTTTIPYHQTVYKMNPKDLYLIAYNLACCLGWAVVWFLSVRSLYDSIVVNGGAWDVAASQVYSNCALWLQVSQTAALMEIVHAAIGFVRSPVMITAMQVMSRIGAIVAIVFAPTAQGAFPKTHNISCHVPVLCSHFWTNTCTYLSFSHAQINGEQPL